MIFFVVDDEDAFVADFLVTDIVYVRASRVHWAVIVVADVDTLGLMVVVRHRHERVLGQWVVRM